MISKIKNSWAYSLAYEDMKFLDKRDLRPIRLQLELLKPELILRKQRIRSTIVVFGSARILSPEAANREIKESQALLKASPRSRELLRRLKQAKMRLNQSHYYTEAQKFAALISNAQQKDKGLEFVIVTGGGPGIMEAANRGAWETGSKSIGLNITLPHEQDPNPYLTPELSFQFHYFSLRKMHFMMRAKAMVAFPGGYGTFDELFEALTLVQTGKKSLLPIVLFGRKFWERVVDWDFLADQGLISGPERRLFYIAEKAEEGWAYIQSFWNKSGRGAWSPDQDERRHKNPKAKLIKR
jgi:hypothetical protein